MDKELLPVSSGKLDPQPDTRIEPRMGSVKPITEIQSGAQRLQSSSEVKVNSFSRVNPTPESLQYPPINVLHIVDQEQARIKNARNHSNVSVLDNIVGITKNRIESVTRKASEGINNLKTKSAEVREGLSKRGIEARVRAGKALLPLKETSIKIAEAIGRESIDTIFLASVILRDKELPNEYRDYIQSRIPESEVELNTKMTEIGNKASSIEDNAIYRFRGFMEELAKTAQDILIRPTLDKANEIEASARVNTIKSLENIPGDISGFFADQAFNVIQGIMLRESQVSLLWHKAVLSSYEIRYRVVDLPDSAITQFEQLISEFRRSNREKSLDRRIKIEYVRTRAKQIESGSLFGLKG